MASEKMFQPLLVCLINMTGNWLDQLRGAPEIVVQFCDMAINKTGENGLVVYFGHA